MQSVPPLPADELASLEAEITGVKAKVALNDYMEALSSVAAFLQDLDRLVSAWRAAYDTFIDALHKIHFGHMKDNELASLRRISSSGNDILIMLNGISAKLPQKPREVQHLELALRSLRIVLSSYELNPQGKELDEISQTPRGAVHKEKKRRQAF